MPCLPRFAKYFSTLLLPLLLLLLNNLTRTQVSGYEFRCPSDWEEYGTNCYKFVRNPLKTYEEASTACSRFNAHLLSVLSVEEHKFITDWLRQRDPVHQSWYTSAQDVGGNSWRWNVPIHVLSTTGATSSLSSASNGIQGALGPLDPAGYNGGGGGGGRAREFFSILATIWLPQDLKQLTSPANQFPANQQQSIIDANRGGGGGGLNVNQPTVWDSRNAQNAVYNFSQSLNRWGLVRVGGAEYHSYVCKMRRQDVNFAAAIERNIDYGINVIDEKQIPRGPRFIHEPESVVFDVSGRSSVNYVSLKCVADGFPTPKYRWYREEYQGNYIRPLLIDPLSDRRYTQTDGILTINGPTTEKDRGKYHCMASNMYGTVISKTVQLTFGYIGEFTKKRSPEYGREFWGKSISCDPPKNHPGVNYHWSRDSFQYIIEDDRRIFISRDGNLYFSSLEKIDRANYSCNVKSSIASSGRTGPFFTLVVESASSSQKLLFPNHFPKIFPDIKLAGSEIRLECMAYGYPVPYYNWSRTGITDRMPEGSYPTSYNRVLIIPQAKVEDSGEYICTATSGKDVISKSVALSIQSLPVILQEIGNKVEERNLETLVWECEAFGIPAVYYQWFKNGIEISDKSKLSIEDANRYEVSGKRLTIHGLLPERDEGMYQCKATNELGTAFSSGQLRIVQIATSFQKYPMPTELYAGEGGNITIPCVPEALPVPTFEWQKDWVRLNTGGGRVRQLANGFLSISPVQRSDEGTYTCTARNSLGQDRTSGRLRVFSRPRLYVRPNPVYERRVGESVSLPCMAVTDASLDVSYIWQHNGLRLDLAKAPQYSMRSTMDGDLTIVNLTLAETGEYECIVQTTVGSVVASTRIQLYAQPGAPGAVVADDITATDARLQWSDGSDNGRRIIGYQVEGITNHFNQWHTILNTTEYANPYETNRETNRKMVHLKGVLSPWSTYRFRVSAFNELGVGLPSEASPSYNTDKAVPFKAPSGVGYLNGKVGTLTITWQPLPPKDWNAPDIYYRVFYKPEESYQQPYIDHNLTKQGNTNTFAVNVGEENYYKRYLVMVQAMNQVGAGLKISDPVVAYSAESMPQVAPTSVYAIAHNSTAMNVTWLPIDTNREKLRGQLIGHRIKYWKLNQDPQLDALQLLKRDPNEPWGLIVGLLPDTEYYIAVMAYNEAGAGPESEPFLARTFKAAPQQHPTSVNVTAIDGRSVLVTWRGISSLSAAEEPIKGYKVRYWDADHPITRAIEVYKYLDGGALQTIISDLVRGKAYKLRVLAFSNGGDGKMSEQIEFRVDDSVPARFSAAGLEFTINAAWTGSVNFGSLFTFFISFLLIKLINFL